MCLAVPGRILAISTTNAHSTSNSNTNGKSNSNTNGKSNANEQATTRSSASPAAGGASARGSASGEDDLWRMAEVDFGGVRQQVSLACLPQARVGDRVLVHVGFALSLVDDDLEPCP